MTGLARMLCMLLGRAAILAPAASADAFRPGHGHRPAVTPLRAPHVSGGELLGEGWAQAIVMSSPERGGCNTLARNVVVPVYGEDSTATCTILDTRSRGRASHDRDIRPETGLIWRRRELNPRPQSRKRQRLRAYPALYISRTTRHAGGVVLRQST